MTIEEKKGIVLIVDDNLTNMETLLEALFLTALSDTETKVKGFDLGAVDYITSHCNIKR